MMKWVLIVLLYTASYLSGIQMYNHVKPAIHGIIVICFPMLYVIVCLKVTKLADLQ